MMRHETVGRALAELFGPISARKLGQVTALLEEIEPLVRGQAREHVICDLACGKSYLLHALAAVAGPRARYLGIDRSRALVEQARTAADRLGMNARFEVAGIADAALPDRPDVLIALHACGDATDEAVARACALRARHALIVPCCHQRPTRAAARAMGLPRQGILRGRLHDALSDARRTLVLEAGGFEVVAVEFVPPAVTPHNLLLRARYVGTTARAARASQALARLSTAAF